MTEDFSIPVFNISMAWFGVWGLKQKDKTVSRNFSWKEKNSSTSAENSLYTQTRLCWRLISISSKCWIPLNINHWTAEFIWTLTKLLSIICPSCAPWAVYVAYLCNSHCLSRKVSILCFIGTFYQDYILSMLCVLTDLSGSVIFPSRLTGNEPLSILPLNSLPEENVGRAHYKLCDRLKLEKKQRRMCRRDPGVAETLREAITMSALECQYQFRFERWNCTLEGRHRANILKRGNELSFIIHIEEGNWNILAFNSPVLKSRIKG